MLKLNLLLEYNFDDKIKSVNEPEMYYDQMQDLVDDIQEIENNADKEDEENEYEEEEKIGENEEDEEEEEEEEDDGGVLQGLIQDLCF